MSRLLLAIVLLLALNPLQAQMQEVERLVPKVLNVYPHDDGAFSQGLLWHDGYLYESTGLYGESTLRRVDIASGEPQVLLSLDDAYFAEGLERVDDRLIQLTWKAGRAFVYDFEALELIETIEYEGEGWGLCFDGRFLFMSDGSSFLSAPRPADIRAHLPRRRDLWDSQLVPAQLLNELECVGEQHLRQRLEYRFHLPYRQVHRRHHRSLSTLRALLTDARKPTWRRAGLCLNGIAYNPESDTFFITGKKWPKIFEVVFVQSHRRQPAAAASSRSLRQII